MPRQMRQRSSPDIYHVMTRGNGGQSLFENEEDNKKFLEVLHSTKNNLIMKLTFTPIALWGSISTC